MTRVRVAAAGQARVLPKAARSLELKGRRECRALDAPAALRAKVRVARTQVVTVTPETPGIPRAMVLTVSFALSLVSRAFLPPSPARCQSICAGLTPASGRQDHTTSPSAIAPFVKGAIHVHRIPPRVRDDRETPLLPRRDGQVGKGDLPDGKSEKFFAGGLDKRQTAHKVICPSRLGKKAAPAGLSPVGRSD